jgi:hypothetical protein
MRYSIFGEEGNMPVIVCNKHKFEIPYINDDICTSQYIKDLVKTFNDVNIEVPIPDVYCPIIGDYIDFVNNVGTSITTITKEYLSLYLNLDTLLIDDAYLSCLIQQIFNQWSTLSDVVYNDLNDDMQWSIFLYSPYDFIPDYLLNNQSFMKRWNKENQDRIIMVNHGAEVYYNNVKSINKDGSLSISIYHTVNGKPKVYLKRELR